jgi:hypothetical protein
MKASPWVRTLLSVATAGGAVLAAPGAAGASTSEPPVATRWAATAQGDSAYYGLNGKGIPLSPENSSGSLTTRGTADDTGATTAFAGAPYLGNAPQHAPGTVNGQLNGNAIPFQFPFTRLPQYVEVAGSDQQAAEDGGYYRISAATGKDRADATADRGAPSAIPAPNKQETAYSTIEKTADGTIVSKAGASNAGFVMGDLEVGNSVVSAMATDATTDKEPRIEGHSSGWFAFGGQRFGFDSDKGFSYAGQQMSQEEALGNLNAGLSSIGVKLDILLPQTSVDEVSGIVHYVIGGLRITSTQTYPVVGEVTATWVLGRAEVSTVNRPLSFDGLSHTATPTVAAAPQAALPAARSRYGEGLS